MNTTIYQFMSLFITLFLNILMKSEFSENIKNLVIIIIISFLNSIIIIKSLKKIRNSMYDFVIFTKEEIFFINEDFIREYCKIKSINYEDVSITDRKSLFNEYIQKEEFIKVKDESQEEVIIKSSNIIKAKFNSFKLNSNLDGCINYLASKKNAIMSTSCISLILSVIYLLILKFIKVEALILFLLFPSIIVNIWTTILIKKSYNEAVKKNNEKHNRIYEKKIEEFTRDKH